MQTVPKNPLRRSLFRSRRVSSSGAASAAVTIALLLGLSTAAHAGPREQAKRIHDRIAGVPPSDDVLDSMASAIAGGDANAAAYIAMDSSGFYDFTLKNFTTPATNRDQTVFAPLNDYTATVIGMVRDDVPFNTLLSADILYTGGSGLGIPAYSAADNAHYEALEDGGFSLRDNLVQTLQSQMNGLPPAATAGIMTTRAAGEAFFIAGTNRAMFRFTLLNHLCNDLEQVRDITRPPDRIRQDVSRSPGGDSRIFLNNCIGCHSGMDPLAQAFAYYDYDEESGRVTYTEGQVAPKYFNNDDVFQFGFITPDDSWENFWREGQNKLLGWDESLDGFGNGAKSMGQELANSEAFAQCQTKKVFRAVCLRDPVDDADRSQIDAMSSTFQSTGYRMKQVFADSAVYCMGD